MSSVFPANSRLLAKNKIRIYIKENVSCNQSINGHVGFGNFTNSPSFTQPVKVLNGFKTHSLTTPTLLGFPFHWNGKAKNRGCKKSRDRIG